MQDLKHLSRYGKRMYGRLMRQRRKALLYAETVAPYARKQLLYYAEHMQIQITNVLASKGK